MCSKPGSIRLDAEGRSKGRWGREPAEHSLALSTRLEEEEGLEGLGQALEGLIQLHIPTSIPKAVGPLGGVQGCCSPSGCCSGEQLHVNCSKKALKLQLKTSYFFPFQPVQLLRREMLKAFIFLGGCWLQRAAPGLRSCYASGTSPAPAEHPEVLTGEHTGQRAVGGCPGCSPDVQLWGQP